MPNCRTAFYTIPQWRYNTHKYNIQHFPHYVYNVYMYTATYHSTDKQYNTADDEEREITEKKYLFDDDNILFLFLSFSIFVPLLIID